MAAEAYKTNYYDKYTFLVVIGGFVRAGFSKADGLEESAETIEYNEGGHLRPHKSPGKIKSKDLTLERGETDAFDMFDWWKKVADRAADSGGVVDTDYKKDIQIIQIDRGGTTRKTWNVYGCWPNSFGVDDWDGGSSEKHVEKLVLVNDGIEPIAGTSKT